MKIDERMSRAYALWKEKKSVNEWCDELRTKTKETKLYVSESFVVLINITSWKMRSQIVWSCKHKHPKKKKRCKNLTTNQCKLMGTQWWRRRRGKHWSRQFKDHIWFKRWWLLRKKNRWTYGRGTCVIWILLQLFFSYFLP